MKKIATTIIILLISICCKAQQLQEPNLDTKIIGTWVSNDDSTHKITFSTDGFYKSYFNNILSSTFTYAITTQCNGRITTANYDIFLKVTEDNGIDTYCNLLNGIHTDTNGVITLSITTEGGKLNLYTKQ